MQVSTTSNTDGGWGGMRYWKIFLLKKPTTKEEVNEIFKKEAQSPRYKGILEATEDPIVSSDVVGNTHSSIVDLSLTQVVGGNMVKIIAWYDNEVGYANRLVEQVVLVGLSPSSAERKIWKMNRLNSPVSA